MVTDKRVKKAFRDLREQGWAAAPGLADKVSGAEMIAQLQKEDRNFRSHYREGELPVVPGFAISFSREPTVVYWTGDEQAVRQAFADLPVELRLVFSV